jgi:hypothetical protein
MEPIGVCLRIRPLSQKEVSDQEKCVFTLKNERSI